MRELLARLFDLRPPDRSAVELGDLGTHAYVVTEWQPGPTTWRPVNMGDLAQEPLRRTRTVRGPLAMRGDLGIPMFQGEKTPDPGENAMQGAAQDMIDEWTAQIGAGGYPS